MLVQGVQLLGGSGRGESDRMSDMGERKGPTRVEAKNVNEIRESEER